MQNVISVFDTTIGSYNLGNNVIMDAVNTQLGQMFPQSQFYRLPPMDIGKYTRNCIRNSDLTFFGGTNSLNNDMRAYKQWDLKLRNIKSVREVVLMGLGWWQYEKGGITPYTRFLLKQTLSSDYLHSVRDEYTKKKLTSIGIESINTSCPTLWDITPRILGEIPKNKADNVVFTITDYNKNTNRDSVFINTCFKYYNKVYCFPQGIGDIRYIESLDLKGEVEYLQPNLQSFDALLSSGKVDYVGTRLHAGIRALQKSVFSIIIGIDNRAMEKSRDFNLPVVSEQEIDSLEGQIIERKPVELNIPHDAILQWKSQFESK